MEVNELMTISDNLMTTMTMIGKAIEKGAVEDVRSYLNITVRQSRQSGVARATCPD